MVIISETAIHFLRKLRYFNSYHQHTVKIYTDNIVHQHMFGSDMVQTHTDGKGNRLIFIPSSANNFTTIWEQPKINQIVIPIKKKWWRFGL